MVVGLLTEGDPSGVGGALGLLGLFCDLGLLGLVRSGSVRSIWPRAHGPLVCVVDSWVRGDILKFW